MIYSCPIWLVVLLVLSVQPNTAAAEIDDLRTIEFETSEVTGADVALSPDSTQLIFTLLGHLFAVPVEGGDARQLTFGPYQHADPVFSPDGNRVAFASNRDGNDGNIFILDLATGSVIQVTDEKEAARPAWSPDGKSIAYISFLARGHHCPDGRSILRRVVLGGGEVETIPVHEEKIRSVFYLPGGKLAWTVHVRGTSYDHDDDQTDVQVLSAPNSVRVIRAVNAIADRTVPHPDGTGFFVRARKGFFQPEFLSYAPLQADGKLDITSLSPQSCFYGSGGFAFAPDEDAFFFGDVGQLWKFSRADSSRVRIDFRARVRLEVRYPAPAPTFTAPVPVPRWTARSIQTPVLSPDNRLLVFGAAGHLWHQAQDAQRARRLFEDDGYERDPVFSPDGKRLLFVWSNGWRDELRVLNFETNNLDVLAAGSSLWHPAWSPNGQRVAFAKAEPAANPQLAIMDLADRSETTLAVTDLDVWSAHPQFGSDGRLFYSSADSTRHSAVFSVSLDGGMDPVRVTSLDVGHIHQPAVSPDGGWLAFRHNTEIWLAPLVRGAIADGTARRITEEGGDSFAFTADGSSIIYSIGNRVWRHPIPAGKPMELPVRLDPERAFPAPLLIHRVRLLDYSTGDFGSETSFFIENGRILRIGAEAGQTLPRDLVTIDAGGRFAIPGFFDMHAHIQRTFHGAWLAYGVTSLRDVGGPLDWLGALADRSDHFASELPRLFFAGDILHGVSSTRDPIMIADAAEARRYVRQWNARGVHFIKTHPGLTWSAQRALVDEAHQLGLPVVEHGDTLAYLLRSVAVGGAFLEHLGFRRYDDVMQLLAATGTRWTPTIAVSVRHAVTVREDPENWVDEKFRAFAPPSAVKEIFSYGILDDMRILQGLWRETRNELHEAETTGVKLLAGTDAPAWLVSPGVSLHQELVAFVDAGLSPLAALRMATQDAATALGAGSSLGSLDVGKLADIVLLDASPLEDIHNTRTIWRVIKDGWLFDPEMLRPPESDSTTK